MTVDQALKDAVAEAVAPLAREVRQLRERLESVVPPQFVSIDEAAHRLGVSRTTVKEMLRRGDLAAKQARPGCRVLIDVAQLRPPADEDATELGQLRRAR
jgi:excisionase family DNA binding protein